MAVNSAADNRYDRYALALIAAFALTRAFLAATLKLKVDEAYGIVVGRRLDLSYLDHPPLHQWIAHFTALATGENVLVRAPFVALFCVTGWAIYTLTKRLFDARAGIFALLLLNSSLFFAIVCGASVLPDGPLTFGLSIAALAAASLFFSEPGPRAAWLLWLIVGLALGVAGLSKYHAVFVGLGLVLFMFVSPNGRRWLSHPAPYAAALVSLATLAPVIVWNAKRDWISLWFQAVRAAPGLESGKHTFAIPLWSGVSLYPTKLAFLIYADMWTLGPWVFIPLVAALPAALNFRARDQRALFCLCLAAPIIVFFALTALLGGGHRPPWPLPGWMFLIPLGGAWLARRAPARLNALDWRLAGAAIACLVLSAEAVYLTPVMRRVLANGPPALRALDKTISEDTTDWTSLREAPLLSAANGAPPAFVLADGYNNAARIAIAIGPRIPVIVYSDARGFSLLYDSAAFVGQDGIIVWEADKRAEAIKALTPYFDSLGEPVPFTITSFGEEDVPMDLIPARGLKAPMPSRYVDPSK